MRILIAPDSFKECLTAEAVAHAIAEGWRRGAPQDELLEMPLADGGEGTTVALVKAAAGTLHDCVVTGPLGDVTRAQYGLIDDGATAIVEVAAGSGLDLVDPDSRDALKASSFGTGELIMAALEHCPTKLIIGLGGSATTDGGVGLLQALGGRFSDGNGQELARGGGALGALAHIDISTVQRRLQHVQIQVATDVTNCLLGPTGAAAVFSPQKGASTSDVEQLERGLQQFARCALTHGFTIDDFVGSGAAGGIGGALGGMLGAEVVAGVDTVMAAMNLESHIKGMDLVITAEGSLDEQSDAGKTPVGVCRLASRYGLPVIALAGVVGEELEALYAQGLTAAFSITQGPTNKEDALRDASFNLARTAEQIARLVHRMRN